MVVAAELQEVARVAVLAEVSRQPEAVLPVFVPVAAVRRAVSLPEPEVSLAVVRLAAV